MLPDLNNLPLYDQTGVNERIERFCSRSIKTSSKTTGLKLALSMIDLTTLEGKDTIGKVRQLCYKAMHPHDSIKDIGVNNKSVPFLSAPQKELCFNHVCFINFIT